MLKSMILIVVLLLSFGRIYCQTPNLILLNGKIFTADDSRPYAEALAISGRRIVAVGSNKDIRALEDTRTRRIDLDGRVVVPGFNDAHTHFEIEPKAIRLDFRSMEPTWSEVADALRSAVNGLPAGEWVVGTVGGNAFGDYRLNRSSLDAISRDHPVVIETFYGHGTVVNSVAMKILGIAERPVDPLAGTYERDPTTGRFNGRAHEYADWVIDRKLSDRASDADALAALRRLGAEAAAFGVTSLQIMPTMRIERFYRLLQRADLPVRVRAIPFSLTSARSRDLSEIRALKRYRPRSSKIRLEGIKWIIDGTPFEHGALMRAAYADAPGEKGRTNFTAAQVEMMLRESLSLNEQILLHAVGDRTIEVIFNAMENIGRAKVVDWSTRRVRIEHADALSGDLIARAKRLNVVVVQNPTHFSFVEMLHSRWGAQMPFENQRKLLEAGIPYAIGSDGPMNPGLNIMFATIHPSRPSEAISRRQAVEAYTAGSAFAEFTEHEKGILKPGMLADMAVLSQDIFSVPPAELPKTLSLLTIVDGKIVHDAKVVK